MPPPLFTKKQMNAPISRDRTKLAACVVNWWCENFPQIPLQFSMQHLGMMAEAAIILAKGYHINNQPEVCAFASLMWLYGPNLDDHKTIRKVLCANVDEEAKIEALYTQVPDRVWDEVSARRDEDRWIALLEPHNMGDQNV